MKKIMNIIFLLQFYEMHAAWVVNDITNQSDLQFVQAARSDDIVIQSISKKLEDAQGLDCVQLGQKDQFGTMGDCKIIAKNSKGQTVVIRFLGDPTYRVAHGRVKDSDLASRNAARSHNKGMMARVMLEAKGVKKLIGYYCGYEKNDQLFNLVLTGKNSNYQVELRPV